MRVSEGLQGDAIISPYTVCLVVSGLRDPAYIAELSSVLATMPIYSLTYTCLCAIGSAVMKIEATAIIA